MYTTPDFPEKFYSGLSGLQLPIPKYLFPSPYENASRLTYYASIFNSIEINSSFYKIPRPATVANWAASVPEHFRFTFKLWKGITHSKGFDFNETDVVRFFDSVNAVAAKKGCILLQFPPSLGSEYGAQLERLLDSVIKLDPEREWKIAVEFRNKSWYEEDVFNFLDDCGATVVVQDIPKSATTVIDQKSDFMYLRFHGPSGNYRESYSEEFLMEYASTINECRAEGKTVFAYFNNTMGDAYDNSKTLEGFVQE
ncbi:MAG TPA: DUF72 domain-containing protein [Salinimicrobium sp.]|nr:DUF72 domain-containing protein [Salinimicrobium sp.]